MEHTCTRWSIIDVKTFDISLGYHGPYPPEKTLTSHHEGEASELGLI